MHESSTHSDALSEDIGGRGGVNWRKGRKAGGRGVEPASTVKKRPGVGRGGEVMGVDTRQTMESGRLKRRKPPTPLSRLPQLRGKREGAKGERENHVHFARAKQYGSGGSWERGCDCKKIKRGMGRVKCYLCEYFILLVGPWIFVFSEGES